MRLKEVERERQEEEEEKTANRFGFFSFLSHSDWSM
jgi:hypothetical protein